MKSAFSSQDHSEHVSSYSDNVDHSPDLNNPHHSSTQSEYVDHSTQSEHADHSNYGTSSAQLKLVQRTYLRVLARGFIYVSQAVLDVILLALAITVQVTLPHDAPSSLLQAARAIWAVCCVIPCVHFASRFLFFPYGDLTPLSPKLRRWQRTVQWLAVAQVCVSVTGALLATFWVIDDTVKATIPSTPLYYGSEFRWLQWVQTELDLLEVVILVSTARERTKQTPTPDGDRTNESAAEPLINV